MAVDGHRKGGKAEREVAKHLKDWWKRLEPTVEFVRTPQSGGWGKAQGLNIASHFNACGDLMTTSKRFPFCVESKWREQWSPDNVINGMPTPPWEWWRQSVDAAKDQSAVPMMWCRKNFRRGTRRSFPWLVWVPHAYAQRQCLSRPDIRWSADKLKHNEVDFVGVLPVVYFYDRFIEMAPHRMALAT